MTKRLMSICGVRGLFLVAKSGAKCIDEGRDGNVLVIYYTDVSGAAGRYFVIQVNVHVSFRVQVRAGFRRQVFD
jgi:hypothetical protein